MSAVSNAALTAVLDQACILQQIPAPTFQEGQRAQAVLSRMHEIGLRDIHIDPAGNVLGRLQGHQSARPLVISAHMDTVFPPDFPLLLDRQPDRITGPGIGDNCLGVASLLQLVPLLCDNEINLAGDLWLAATTCEEGLGNLSGMQALAERFDSTPAAYISLEGMGLGNILHRGLGVERYRISAHTAGGHSWVDYGSLSAVHELSVLANKLISLKLPHHPRTSLNIGILKGGTSINTIAAEAYLELDLRSESPRSLNDLSRKVNQMVHDTKKTGLVVDIERIGWRPAGEIPTSHALVQLIQQILRNLGITPHSDIASTEANLPLSLGYPGVTIGLTIGDRAHSAQEYILTAPLENGLLQLVELTKNIWLLGIE